MRRITLIPVLLSLMALAGCGPQTITLSPFDGSSPVSVNIEIADSPKEREQGLMKRKSLEPGTGMLFVFREGQMLKFWMKDTLIPLDILFFDKNGEFVNGVTMEPCKGDPCPQYASASLAQYALEVPSDFRITHKIGSGWKLNLDEIRKIARPS